MTEWGINPVSRPAPPDPASRYARMIPGTSAVPATRLGRATRISPQHAPPVSKEARAPQPRSLLVRLLLPHPIADAWNLYQSVSADLLVLIAVGFTQLHVLPNLSFHYHSLPLFAVLLTLFAFSEGLYRETPDPFPPETVPTLIRSTAFATILVCYAVGDARHIWAAPETFAGGLGGLLIYRQVRQFAWAHIRKDAESRRILLVGAGPIGQSIGRALRNDPFHRAVVRGFLDDELPLSPDVIGRVDDLDWLARGEFIDEIILALPDHPETTRYAAEVAFHNHLDIRAVPDLPPGPWPDAAVDYVGEIPVITLHRETVPKPALFLKRLLDFGGAACAITLAAPVMAIIALLIRLESPGPILYSADRTGAKGRHFRCHKFRSMVSNADHLKDDLRARNQRDGPIFKIVEDPRITRMGRFLRRYSLDELPQFWNVLRGEMSLVGPRPHPVEEVNRYELHHYRRLDVKPGITGLWQITARHSSSFELNMHLDLTYIENWSLLLDLRILFGTIRVLFAPEGS
ncbi:MAG: sugar transferase [Terriglobales bacterium]